MEKMMEQKKEEQERRKNERNKENKREERMSLAVTKEWILKLQEKLMFLQEEKTQLFLHLTEVLHEEEKWR